MMGMQQTKRPAGRLRLATRNAEAFGQQFEGPARGMTQPSPGRMA